MAWKAEQLRGPSPGALTPLVAPWLREPHFQGAARGKQKAEQLPLSAGPRSPEAAQEASLLLLTAAPHSWETEFERKEAQLPSTAGAWLHEAALEKGPKAPVF